MSRGWILPENFVYEVLADGYAALLAAIADASVDALLLRIFNNLDDAKRAKVVDFFRDTPVDFRYMYAPPSAMFPCIAVVVDPNLMTASYLGDSGWTETRESDGANVEVSAEKRAATIGVVAYSESPDECRYLAQWADWTVSRTRRSLSDVFGHSQKVSTRDINKTMQSNDGRFILMRAVSFTGEFDQLDVDPVDVGETITGFAGHGTVDTPRDLHVEF